MPVMADLRSGTRVRVALGRRAVVGEILDVRQPHELPLGGNAVCRDTLEKWGVSRLAMIRYNYGGQMVAFAAMEIEGEWCDLALRKLTLEIVGQLNRA